MTARRWAGLLAGLFAAGVAAVFVAAPYLDVALDCDDDPFDLS